MIWDLTGLLPDSFPLEDEPEESPPYYCVVCGHACLRFKGIVLHDNVHHPPAFFLWDEESNPQ